MIASRRNSGRANVHRALVGIEAMLLWIALSRSGISYTTLLPGFSYPLAILVGAMLPTVDTKLFHEPTPTGKFRVSYLDATHYALRQAGFICGTIFSLVVVCKDPGLSRFFLLSYVAALLPVLTVLNHIQPKWISVLLKSTGTSIPTLIVGDASAFPDFRNWLANNQRMGVNPIGQVAYNAETSAIPSLRQLGSFADIPTILRDRRVMQIVMLEPPANRHDAETLLRICLANGTRLLIHNHYAYKLDYPFQTIQDERHSFLTLQDEPLEDPLNRALKRGLDILVATIVLTTVMAPLAALVAIFHRRQSPGPLFHSQLRTGHNQSPFRILKFRTMHTQSGDSERQATAGDSRVFPFGRFLRRSSLDEIPQFINVLRGEMSTVGPRPHMLAHSNAFSRDLDIYLLRYFAKPGITGLAQCSGFRGITTTPDQLRGRVQLDLEYIRTWSIWIDIWIILKTARQVLFPPSTAV